MLIVAIPKSASTALLHTLGKASGYPAKQLIFQEAPLPPESQILYQYHSDVRLIPPQHLNEFTAQKKWYKQHVFPSESNLAALRGNRKIILLRNPIEILEAYRRAIQKHIHNEREELTTRSTMNEWTEQANKNGLLEDLTFFHKQWTQEAERFPQENLIIEYKELISDPDSVIRNTLDFFEIDAPTKPISLAKKRYSRGSKFNTLINYALRKIGK